ncbi:unnamed protein product, partial [Ectocarpus fasciculatus]
NAQKDQIAEVSRFAAGSSWVTRRRCAAHRRHQCSQSYRASLDGEFGRLPEDGCGFQNKRSVESSRAVATGVGPKYY